MDLRTPPARTVGAAETRWWFWPSLALLLGAFAVMLARYGDWAIVGADDHGYVAQGARLVADGRATFTLESPIQYVGRHWLRDSTGRYVSRYSPGVGMAVAAVRQVAGPDASLAVNAGAAVLTLLALALLARRQLGDVPGLVAPAFLAVSPVFIGQAMLMGSHQLVALCATWGTYWLLEWRERGTSWRLALAALAFALIPMVRPSDVVMGLGAVYLVAAVVVVSRQRPWRDAMVAGLVAVGALAPLLWYNQVTFGSAASTAYAITDEQSGFALSYVRRNVIHYAQYLLRDGLGVALVLAVPGAVAWVRSRERRQTGVVLLVIVGAMVALYLPFFHVPRTQPALAARFLLPVLPFVALFAAAALRGWTAAGGARLTAATLAVVLLGHAWWGARGTVAMAREYRGRKARAASVVALAREHIPAGSVVFSSEEVFLTNLDVQRRWRVAERLVSLDSAENAVLDGTVASRGRGNQVGKRRVQTAPFEGLDARARDSLFLAFARDWGGRRPVFYLGPQRLLDRPTSALMAGDQFDVTVRQPVTRGLGDAREPFVVARWLGADRAAPPPLPIVSASATMRP